jgi:lantibiotic modifying enzyme
MYEDILGKLGLTSQDANTRISGSLLGGYLNYYGIRNLHSIATGDRATVIKDIAVYTKQYAGSESFKKDYDKFRESNKPQAPQKMQTAEEMRAEMIKITTDNIKKFEADLKTSNEQMKPINEQMLAEFKKQLKSFQDPNNDMIKSYAQNYKESERIQQESYQNLLKEWEAKYPANQLYFVKTRLQEFLNATEDIDFNAALTERNGKKYFADTKYEHKGSRWKMGYRAGKGAVEAARAFAQQWLAELK